MLRQDLGPDCSGFGCPLVNHFDANGAHEPVVHVSLRFLDGAVAGSREHVHGGLDPQVGGDFLCSRDDVLEVGDGLPGCLLDFLVHVDCLRIEVSLEFGDPLPGEGAGQAVGYRGRVDAELLRYLLVGEVLQVGPNDVLVPGRQVSEGVRG